ncbi:MAG: PIN domain-containing protein [Candidatus Dadabacteria bacterium]|nr:MAG: PIN domain-containing protein [Candidatus Dadabacteria bacterium]
MRALLDVNVLIALFDANHVRHDDARAWLEGSIDHGWASCPITQNGFLRIITTPAYPAPIPFGQAVELLADATATRWHQFWPDDVSLLSASLIRHDRIHGPKQITDSYLLALAVAHEGRFVTFDRHISVDTVHGARKANLTVID